MKIKEHINPHYWTLTFQGEHTEWGRLVGRAEIQEKDSDVARLEESIGDKGGKVFRDLNHVLILAGTPQLFLRVQAWAPLGTFQ